MLLNVDHAAYDPREVLGVMQGHQRVEGTERVPLRAASTSVCGTERMHVRHAHCSRRSRSMAQWNSRAGSHQSLRRNASMSPRERSEKGPSQSAGEMCVLYKEL